MQIQAYFTCQAGRPSDFSAVTPPLTLAQITDSNMNTPEQSFHLSFWVNAKKKVPNYYKCYKNIGRNCQFVHELQVLSKMQMNIKMCGFTHHILWKSPLLKTRKSVHHIHRSIQHESLAAKKIYEHTCQYPLNISILLKNVQGLG